MNVPLSNNAVLSNECYTFIAKVVYDHSRIQLGADKQPLVAGRLNKRLRELNLDSYEAYCNLLRSPVGASEMSPLVDLISTNHTHFFREVQHMDRVKLPDPQLLTRYFQNGTGDLSGYYRVKQILRDAIKFHHLNLLHSPYPVAQNQHIIFCRNVMIYFDQKTQQELVNKLTQQLAPGGYLIVGHSESLLAVKHRLKSVRPTIYRKDP